MIDPCLIMTAGLPGVGKTTIAELLATALDHFEVISQNNLRREFGLKKMPQRQENILREIDVRSAKVLREGKGVIFDSVNRYLFRRHQMYGVASCCNCKVITLEVVCSEQEAKRRIRLRPNADNLLSDPNDPRVYTKLAASWEDIIEDFKYPGEDHVSYVQLDTETNAFKVIVGQPNMKSTLKELESILVKGCSNA